MEFQTYSDSSPGTFIFACVIFLFIVLFTVGIYVFALTRKAADAVRNKPSRIKVLHSPLAYSDAINRLIQMAPAQGYKVEDVTPDGSRVTLGTNITFFSYGFFYPVYFSVEPSGTMVEVGIVSRAFQWGPVVGFNHDKVATMVSNALMPWMPNQQQQMNSPYPPNYSQPQGNPTMPMPPAPPQYPPNYQQGYPQQTQPPSMPPQEDPNNKG